MANISTRKQNKNPHGINRREYIRSKEMEEKQSQAPKKM